jgi:hypothetical protein
MRDFDPIGCDQERRVQHIACGLAHVRLDDVDARVAMPLDDELAALQYVERFDFSHTLDLSERRARLD